MAFTQIQLDTLDAALATGTLTVMYGNKSVTYRSIDEMLRLRNLMAAELGLTNSKDLNNGRTYGKYYKGLI